MKQSRFTDEQIIGFLKQADAGMSVKELCRSGGFSQPTFYKWRSRFGGMQPSDADWQQFVCIEPVIVDRPITLEPGAFFEGKLSMALFETRHPIP